MPTPKKYGSAAERQAAYRQRLKDTDASQMLSERNTIDNENLSKPNSADETMRHTLTIVNDPAVTPSQNFTESETMMAVDSISGESPMLTQLHTELTAAQQRLTAALDQADLGAIIQTQQLVTGLQAAIAQADAHEAARIEAERVQADAARRIALVEQVRALGDEMRSASEAYAADLAALSAEIRARVPAIQATVARWAGLRATRRELLTGLGALTSHRSENDHQVDEARDRQVLSELEAAGVDVAALCAVLPSVTLLVRAHIDQPWNGPGDIDSRAFSLVAAPTPRNDTALAYTPSRLAASAILTRTSK